MLMDMGYEARSAKRALKMTGYDIQSSVDLLCEEREKKIRRKEEDRKRQREILWASNQAVYTLPFNFFNLLLRSKLFLVLS